ncbi:MAG TPA: hypothetical protein IAC41_02620, partial [Candidatus Merdenecus merdavium]|nr:hypothetical protein [Candidatus Merdenecus merdavium]
EWDGMIFSIHYHNRRIEISIDGRNQVSTTLLEGEEIQVKINNQMVTLKGTETA